MRLRSSAIAMLAIALATSGCELGYLLKQGAGQVGLIWQREPIDAAERDARLTDAEKQRLAIVRAAKAFAIDRIGLHRSASYDQVVVLDRSAVSYVVSGAPKAALAPYLWHYPVIGAAPYKGFFDPQDAKSEKASLEARGYDAYLRGVSAFSLLGFFPDPLYSPLLRYESGTLANIIIHELTHATVFLSGNSSFNEGFATFVGDQGELWFLQERYGADSTEVQRALALKRDDERFRTFAADLVHELRDLYALPLTPAEKVRRREQVFAAAHARFGLLAMETEAYRGFSKVTLNNAYLMTLMTYRSNTTRFQRVYDRLHQDLPAMVRFFRDQVAKDPHPEAFLDRWLDKEGEPSGPAFPLTLPSSPRGEG